MRAHIACCKYALIALVLAGTARADLAGQVYRIEYQNAGVEDCLRFDEDGHFTADSSLTLPPGNWAQRGPVYTAYQGDRNGNTFTWGGAQRESNAQESRLLGAFVSSLGIRLTFSGTRDPQCEVSFEDGLALAPYLVAGQRAAAGEVVYEVRGPTGTVIDCLRLHADGGFEADSLRSFAYPPGAWHGSGIALAAYQSSETDDSNAVNTWGGLALAAGSLWLAVDSTGVRQLGRINPACELQP